MFPARTTALIDDLVSTLADAEVTKTKLANLARDPPTIHPEKVASHFEGCCKHVRVLAVEFGPYGFGLGPIDYDDWRVYQFTDTYGTPYAIEVSTLIETPEETCVEYVNNRAWLEEEGCLDHDDWRSGENLCSRAIRKDGLFEFVTEGSEGLIQEVSYGEGGECRITVTHPDGSFGEIFLKGGEVTVLTRQGQEISFVGGKVVLV